MNPVTRRAIVKDICVWLVVLSETFFGACYIFQIWRKKAVPTISTWIIFFVGCGLSFLTYAIAENRDIKSGIFNTADLFYVLIILFAIILWGKHEVRFRPFEKWYLLGAVGIVVYGLITGNAWNSNVLTQVLMSFAYCPMWHKMIARKKNTESFLGWIPVPALAALYPATHEGNVLSIIYAYRALLLCTITIIIMAYYQLKERHARQLLR